MNVCASHTVCIQVVYSLLKCVCNKKRTSLKNIFSVKQLEFNLIISDVVNPIGSFPKSR